MRSRSASLIPVTLPSGIALVTTTCSYARRAFTTICCWVSNRTPLGAAVMPSRVGCAEWQVLADLSPDRTRFFHQLLLFLVLIAHGPRPDLR